MKEVWYQGKLILHLIFFGADYTSGAGSVWDYIDHSAFHPVSSVSRKPCQAQVHLFTLIQLLYNNCKKEKKEEEELRQIKAWVASDSVKK